MSKIQKISAETNYDDLVYYFKGSSSPVSFIEYEDPLDIYDKIKNGDKIIQAAENEQKNKKKNKKTKKIKSKLSEITSGNPEHKSKDPLDAIKNVQNLYNSRQKNIDLFKDNAKIKSEAIYEAKQDETKGTALKILTPKQMFLRLPKALAQVNAVNNSESLLNEIRHRSFIL